MDVWFHKQNKILQAILLIIPVVNWFVEILVRWSSWLKNGGPLRLLICVIVTLPLGMIFGWIDAICTLVTNKIVCE